MRALIFLFLASVCGAAQVGVPVQFVAVMVGAKDALFAVRASEGAKTQWVSLGDRVAGFVVLSFDAKADALTLQRGEERVVLKLPDSRVQMARDELVDGL